MSDKKKDVGMSDLLERLMKEFMEQQKEGPLDHQIKPVRSDLEILDLDTMGEACKVSDLLARKHDGVEFFPLIVVGAYKDGKLLGMVPDCDCGHCQFSSNKRKHTRARGA